MMEHDDRAAYAIQQAIKGFGEPGWCEVSFPANLTEEIFTALSRAHFKLIVDYSVEED